MSGDVKVISRVAAILNSMVEDGASSLKMISITAGLPLTTTSRLLASMQQVGFVERDPLTKEYCLGPNFLRMAALVEPRRDIASLLRPYLEELTAATTEDSGLAELVGDTALLIDRVEGSHPLKIIDKLNKPELLYVGAFRKVLLAWQEPQWIDDYISRTPFEKFTDNTITNEKTLKEELAKIREQGYAVSLGERIADGGGIAAPIFGPTGKIRAAVQIAGPLARISQQSVIQLSKHVVDVSLKCTASLGGTMPSSKIDQPERAGTI